MESNHHVADNRGLKPVLRWEVLSSTNQFNDHIIDHVDHLIDHVYHVDHVDIDIDHIDRVLQKHNIDGP